MSQFFIGETEALTESENDAIFLSNPNNELLDGYSLTCRQGLYLYLRIINGNGRKLPQFHNYVTKPTISEALSPRTPEYDALQKNSIILCEKLLVEIPELQKAIKQHRIRAGTTKLGANVVEAIGSSGIGPLGVGWTTLGRGIGVGCEIAERAIVANKIKQVEDLLNRVELSITDEFSEAPLTESIDKVSQIICDTVELAESKVTGVPKILTVEVSLSLLQKLTLIKNTLFSVLSNVMTVANTAKELKSVSQNGTECDIHLLKCLKDVADLRDELVIHQSNLLMKSRTALENALNESIPLCDKLVEDITGIQKSLKGHRRNVRISKITGGAAGVAGGSLALVGILGMPVTFGSSGALVAAGAAVSAAGTGVTVGSDIVKRKITKKKMEEVEDLMNELQKSVAEVTKNTHIVLKLIHATSKFIGVSGGMSVSIGVVAMPVQIEETVSKVMFATLATSSAKIGITVLTAAASIFSMILDTYTIINSAYKLTAVDEYEARLDKCIQDIVELKQQLTQHRTQLNIDNIIPPL